MKKVKVSHKGRKCKFPLCKQILSIYNHEIYCHVHLGKAIYEFHPKVAK